MCPRFVISLHSSLSALRRALQQNNTQRQKLVTGYVMKHELCGEANIRVDKHQPRVTIYPNSLQFQYPAAKQSSKSGGEEDDCIEW